MYSECFSCLSVWAARSGSGVVRGCPGGGHRHRGTPQLRRWHTMATAPFWKRTHTITVSAPIIVYVLYKLPPLVLKARHLRVRGSAFCWDLSRQWDGCPLGLGLVVEGEPTEFPCNVYMYVGDFPTSYVLPGYKRHVVSHCQICTFISDLTTMLSFTMSKLSPCWAASFKSTACNSTKSLRNTSTTIPIPIATTA